MRSDWLVTVYRYDGKLHVHHYNIILCHTDLASFPGPHPASRHFHYCLIVLQVTGRQNTDTVLDFEMPPNLFYLAGNTAVKVGT